MRDNGSLVVWLLYMFYRYTVVLYTVTSLKSFEAICVRVLSLCFAASSKSSPEYAVQFFFFIKQSW